MKNDLEETVIAAFMCKQPVILVEGQDDIKFYDINETPPKVTIKIDSSTATSFNGDNLNISNKISSVMETNYKENVLTTKLVNSGKLDYSQIDEVYTKALAAS